MRISIIGTGYVGIVSGVCLAEKGHHVVCVDNNSKKVSEINAGQAPIFEAGLDELLSRHIGENLIATDDLPTAVAESEITLIAVGTPFDGKNIDLRFIQAVSEEIGTALRTKDDYHVVVIKSTVIPGTTDSLVRETLESSSGKKIGASIGLGMNPEFLTEGTAVADFMYPDRIVIGGCDRRSQDVLANIYAGFTDIEKIYTNNSTAEMIKYTSNSILATMISFSNEIAALCEALGDIDVVDVMRAVHASAYFTTRTKDNAPVTAAITSFLEAGCGFGGSCLPKDIKALASQGNANKLPMHMLNAVIATNLGQPEKILEIAKQHYPSIQGLKVAILGLAFKPDTDDIRESPAFPIIRLFADEGADLVAYDPVATDNARPMLTDIEIEFAKTMESAVADCTITIIVTSWSEFSQLPELISQLATPPLIIDGRRMLDKNTVKRYAGIGLS